MTCSSKVANSSNGRFTFSTGKKNEYFGQPGLSNEFTKEEHFLVSETISISILKLYSLETMTIVIMSTPKFWG